MGVCHTHHLITHTPSYFLHNILSLVISIWHVYNIYIIYYIYNIVHTLFPFCKMANLEPFSQFDWRSFAFMHIGNQIPNLTEADQRSCRLVTKFPIWDFANWESYKLGKNCPICKKLSLSQFATTFPICFCKLGTIFPICCKLGKFGPPCIGLYLAPF